MKINEVSYWVLIQLVTRSSVQLDWFVYGRMAMGWLEVGRKVEYLNLQLEIDVVS